MRTLRRALANPWIIFLVTVLAHGLYTRGTPSFSGDTSLYGELAKGYLAGDFSGIFHPGGVRWTKLMFLSILALASAVAPAKWPLIIMTVNILCSGLTAVVLMAVVRRATSSTIAWLAAFALYLGAFDVARWVSFILTDMMYALAAILPFYLLARWILEDRQPRPLLLVGSLLLASFTRPPGVVIAALALFAVLVLIRKRMSLRTAIAIMLIFGAAAVLARAYFVHDPSRWPLRYLQRKMVEFHELDRAGVHVHGWQPKPGEFDPPDSIGDHALMALARAGRFFQFTAAEYSPRHNLANAAYYVPLYLLAIAGAISTLRDADPKRRALVVLLLVWIGVFALFHGVTMLDSDWRFRTPLLPFFIVLAAFGVERIARGVAARHRPPDAPAIHQSNGR